MISFDTTFPADSLEFCPISGFQSLFVCGTYKLEDQPAGISVAMDGVSETEESEIQPKLPQKRKGQCLTFQLVGSGLDTSFQQLQTFDLPAILDLKWYSQRFRVHVVGLINLERSHRSAKLPPLLGIADSEGSITLHEWREGAFTKIQSIRCAPTDTLVLSLDWSNRRSKESTGSIVASLSDGTICILRAGEDNSMVLTDTWHAHDYEPWVAAWNYWDTNVLYSGGDDLKLKAWDVRQGFDQPVATNKRFNAGVTSIQCHPHVEHLIAVGSYNNSVKLFDTRKLSTSISEVDVGGGAWRVKWHPSEARRMDLLVASMHDGFKVVRFGTLSDGISLSGTPEITNRNDEHSSMAYGADWCFGGSDDDQTTVIGGCSFYDHKMSLWNA